MHELYDYTTEQALNFYKGKVQDWRFHRACADLIHRSLVKEPVDILKAIPLPFDEEIAGRDSGDDWEKYYYEAKEKGLV